MTLPKAYINVVRDLTAYWGTYPPSDVLAPGMVGRVKDGLFVQEDTLASYAGYDAAQHGAGEPQPSREPVTIRQSADVIITSTQVNANVPAANVGGSVHLGFNEANNAVLIFKEVRLQGLLKLAAVRQLMTDLLAAKKWDTDLCIVTNVQIVDAGWICFSTSSGQEAEIKGSGSVGLTSTPLDALTGMAVKGNLDTSWSDKKSAGYSTEITSGATPLFLALQFKRDFVVGPMKLQFLRGEAKGFEEPMFGDPAAAEGANSDAS